MDFLNLLVGGAGRGGPVEAALLIGLFWAAISHPERIRSVIEFRIATVLLAASMVVPVVVQLYLAGQASSTPRLTGFQQPQPPGNAMYAMAISPFLVMLAVIIGVNSVTPYGRTKEL